MTRGIDRLYSKSPFLWLASSLFKFKRLLVVTFLSTIVVAAGEFFAPVFILYFIDTILPKKSLSALYMFVVLMVVMYAFVLLASSIRTYYQRELSEKCCNLLNVDGLRHLRKLGMPYYEKKSLGAMFSLFNNDVAQVQRIYRDLLPGTLHKSIFTVASLVLMFSIEPVLTAISLLLFFSFYFFGTKYDKLTGVLSKELHHVKVKFDKRVYSHVAGHSELRSYGSQEWDSERIVAIQGQYNKLDLKRMFYIWTRLVIRRLVISTGILIIFIYSGYVLRHNLVSIGELSAYLVNFFLFMGSFTNLLTILTEQRMLKGNVEALYEFFQQREEFSRVEINNGGQVGRLTGNITFENIYFSYGENEVLRDINLNIRSGETIAFVGKSGCGKTTLLKLIGRFYDPTMGRILIDGKPLPEIDTRQFRNSVAFVFQDPHLFDDSIYNNILFGNPEATEEEVIVAAKAADLHEFILTLPLGYETKVGERGSNLSGGQKQRLCIARLFVKSPPIIVLDEATSALDALSEDEILKSLKTLFKGSTIISVSHRVKAMRFAEKIVMFDKGMIAETGSYEELWERKGAFYNMVNEEDDTGERYRLDNKETLTV